MTGTGPAWPAEEARILPMGEDALLLKVPDTLDPGAVAAFAAELGREPVPEQTELVPGAASLLVIYAGPAAPGRREELAARWRSWTSSWSAVDDTGPAEGDLVTIDVVYDGPDLDRVADLTGLSTSGVVTAHTAGAWRVAFCGFAPGFAYLSGGDGWLTVPRRDTPRPEVPVGAVGLAGGYSGIYPRPSPGGWQLIGRTGAVLWDAGRDQPALLRPGLSVAFRAVRAVSTTGQPKSEPAQGDSGPHDAPAAAHGLAVLRPGLQCLAQDLGRPGHADAGVGRSGAADRGALRRANRAVSNAPGEAVLEILLGGAEFRAEGDLTIALAGAPVEVSLATASPNDVDGSADAAQRSDATTPPTALGASEAADPSDHAARSDQGAPPDIASYQRVPSPMERPIDVPHGARIRLGRPAVGLRTYLAVRGGIDVPPVLGSRSTDLLAGLGLAPVAAGQVLPIGHGEPAAERVEPRLSLDESDAAAGRMAPPGSAGIRSPADPRDPAARRDDHEAANVKTLAILPGPQRDWFTNRAWAMLWTASWQVAPASNRVGVRLSGPALDRVTSDEMPSQGLVRGAIQVPPSGELVAFLADHPVTGGYPVIAVLTAAATDRLAQCRPGEMVRFRIE